ncbi:MAG: GNAT family N-acetyltransferase [Lachnospiraceae bacterium]|nr:GNAT family N-acetyltransferase [Lachnospiraceae bacterium]
MIRKATINDVDKIIYFIKELAKYEKMSELVTATPELIKEWIFEKKKASVIFAVENDKEVGYALYFYNYSTFTGKAGLYLEDLFVLPEYRYKGYGLVLINELKNICKKEKLGRFEWQCLNWNESSIKFYEKLGAKQDNQWLIFRMEEKQF